MKHEYLVLTALLFSASAFAQKPGSIHAPAYEAIAAKAMPGALSQSGQRGGGPANDECGGAIPITVNSACETVSGSLDGATQSQDPAACSNFTASAANDVWFSFVANAASTTVQVTGGGDNTTGVDAVLQVFTGSCADLAPIACIDATLRGGTETLLVTTVPGTTYYYRVYYWPYTAAQTVFDFTTCVFALPVPWHDDCVTPMPLTVNTTCVPVGFTTTGATESLPPIECATFTSPNALDVWFSFVATGTEHTVGVYGPNEADAMVEIFSGDCGTLTSLACADATFPQAAGEATTEALVQTGLTPGNTYYVRVYDWGHFSDDHFFEICVTEGSNTNVGISEVASAEAWGIFPNPAESEFTITYGGENGAAVVEVLDMTGRLVHAERIVLAKGGAHAVDLAGMGAGTYAVRLTAHGVRSEKLLILN
jgi:hypothetical protein